MKGKVMVVDDEYDLLQAVCGVLEDEGYEVKGCDSGKAAVACLQQDHFGVIVLDVMMPKMNGLQLLKIIRDMPEGANLPVILMSAVPVGSTDFAAIGFNFFLEKPFDIDVLLNAVQHLLHAVSQSPENIFAGDVWPALNAKPPTAP